MLTDYIQLHANKKAKGSEEEIEVPVPTHLLSNAHKPVRENGQLDGIQVGPNFLNIATTNLQEILRIFNCTYTCI